MATSNSENLLLDIAIITTPPANLPEPADCLPEELKERWEAAKRRNAEKDKRKRKNKSERQRSGNE